MASDRQAPPVSTWDVRQVCSWLKSAGFSDLVQGFEEHGVAGESLLKLDHGRLKELSVRTVGRRIAILNAVYELKMQHQIPVDDDDYIPASKRSSPVRLPFEAGSPLPPSPNIRSPELLSELSQLEAALHERDDPVDHLLQEVQRLNMDMGHVREDLSSLWKVAKARRYPKHLPKRSSPMDSTSEIGWANHSRSPKQEPEPSNHTPDQQEEKSFRISPNDPCHKVLKSALNPYKLEQDWKEYALFIVYDKNKRTERCLNYGEKPHKLFQRLKDANEAPVLVLKHIKHLPTPVSRKANRSGKSDGSVEPEMKGSGTAVAVYEYTAERDDELDVAIGNEFAMRSRPTDGWCVVEREGRVGWVPAAVLEDAARDELEGSEPLEGKSLFDYVTTGTNELNIKKDDVLLIEKKHRHWLFANCNGRKGWVPSCYIFFEGNGVGEGDASQQSEVPEGLSGLSGDSILITTSPAMLRITSAGNLTSLTDSSKHEILAHGKQEKAKPSSSQQTPGGDVPPKSSEMDGNDGRVLEAGGTKSVDRTGYQSARPESEPNSSARLTKLFVPLDNLNPHMAERTSGTTNSEIRLEAVLKELNSSLLKWKLELGPWSEDRGAKEGEDPLSESLDLTDLVGTLSRGSPQRPKIRDMLEELIRENGSDQDEIGDERRLRIQSKVERTFLVLSKVVDVLFKDQEKG